MDDDEVAKIALVNNNIFIKAYPVIIAGKLSEPQGHFELSMTSIETTEYLKFNLPIEIRNESLSSINKGSCYIITNWHLENQNIERSFKDFYIWEGNKIYKNELIKGFISNFNFQNNDFEVRNISTSIYNPFEVRDISTPIYNPFETKTMHAKANLIIKVLKPVAMAMLPQLKSIYIINTSSIS